LVVTVHAAIAVAVLVTALETWAQTHDGDLVAIVDAAFRAAETATAPRPSDSATSQIIRSPQPARATEHRRRSM
jgi:hypothetical protein